MIKNFLQSKLFKQLFRFGIVGGIAFIIDYSIMVLCKEVFNLSTLLSAGLGFTISVIFNYIASIKWVFDVSKKNSSTKQFILFIVFSIMGLVITEAIMWFGEDVLKVSYLIVKIFATAVVMIFNFITRKMFLE